MKVPPALRTSAEKLPGGLSKTSGPVPLGSVTRSTVTLSMPQNSSGKPRSTLWNEIAAFGPLCGTVKLSL